MFERTVALTRDWARSSEDTFRRLLPQANYHLLAVNLADWQQQRMLTPLLRMRAGSPVSASAFTEVVRISKIARRVLVELSEDPSVLYDAGVDFTIGLYAGLIAGQRPDPELLETLCPLPMSAEGRSYLYGRALNAGILRALAEGGVPQGFPELLQWLGKKKGVKLQYDTYRTYLAIIEMALQDDREAVRAGLLDAVRLFRRRRRSAYYEGGSMLLGGGEVNDDMLDYVICAIVRRLGLEDLAGDDPLLQAHCRTIRTIGLVGEPSISADEYLQELYREHGGALLVQPGSIGLTMKVEIESEESKTRWNMSCVACGEQGRVRRVDLSAAKDRPWEVKEVRPQRVRDVLEELGQMGLWELKSYTPTRAVPLEHRTVEIFAKGPGGQRKHLHIVAPEWHRDHRAPKVIERIESFCRS